MHAPPGSSPSAPRSAQRQSRGGDGGRFVIDARYVDAKPSGIGRYVEALIQRLPSLAPATEFELWTHPERPQPVSFANAHCSPLRARADGLRTLLAPSLLGALRPNDVVHFPFSLLGRGLSCATVVTIHDLMWLEQPELVDRRPWLRRARQAFYQRGMLGALARASRIIAISEATAARIRAIAPASAERVRVTHNAASSAFVPSADEAAARHAAASIIGSSAPYYLVVGKNEPYKAHEVALEAFARAAGADELLVLIQRAGSGAGLNRLASELGIAKRLRFLPSVSQSELLSLLQGARALLQPSIVEGFGIPVLEAMAAGCPVIASDTPALVEVLGGAGLHAPIGDRGGFAAALTRLRDPQLREGLRQRGLQRARHFDWDQTAAATLAVYREAAAEARQTRAVTKK
jgi:glycosyltransferase involved in cell wall biosynthesis